MTEYSYTASDAAGKEHSGTISAHSLQAARENLASQGLQPIEIIEAPKDQMPAVQAAPMQPPEPAPSFVGDAAESMNIPTQKKAYFPLYETIRLYAGWLLAWYCLVYAIGSYQFIKDVPVHIPYAESLFLSPLVLSFTFGAYLFLLLSGIYKYAGKKKQLGFVLLLLGVGLFIWYRMNVQ